jgi:hypothetical protein
LAVSLLCLSVLTGCVEQTVVVDAPPAPDPSTRAIDQNGVSFQYPGTWRTVQVPMPSPSPGQPAPVEPMEQSVQAVGIDELNFVSLSYGISGLPTEDFAQWSGLVREAVAQRSASGGLTLLTEPHEVTASGMRALRYEARAPSGVGYVVHVTWVGFVRRTTQFVVQCFSMAEHAAEIQQGCDQVLATLRVG